MKNFKHNPRSSGRHGGKSYAKPSFGKGGFGAKKESHKARCNNCGNACTVPFRPNGSKPVLCRECFKGNKVSFSNKSFGDRPAFGRSFKKPSYGGKPSYNSKPSYDRRSSERRSTGPSFKKEIDEMNKKLDRVLYLLDKLAPASSNESTPVSTETISFDN